jgi:hypothetical protein
MRKARALHPDVDTFTVPAVYALVAASGKASAGSKRAPRVAARQRSPPFSTKRSFRVHPK